MEAKEVFFGDILNLNAKRNPDSIAIAESGLQITYKELKEKTEAFAASMLQMGVRKGTHVVLWSVNSISWVITFLAAHRIGAVVCLLNYGLKLPDAAALTDLVDGEFMFFGKVAAQAKDPLIAYEVAEKNGIRKERVINIESSLTACSDSIPPEEREAGLNPHDTTVIIYTSGTSGTPKAAMLSAYSLINTAAALSDVLKPSSFSKLCLALPLFHSYGLMMNTQFLIDGKCICIPDTFKPDAVVSCVAQMDCDELATVGAVYVGLLKHLDFRTKIAGRLHLCTIGGGASAPSQLVQFEKAFENTVFLNGYGQTEASPLITLPRLGDTIRVRSETVGKAIPGIEVAIMDADGSLMNPGGIGEIVVKGYNLMNGYYKLPKEKQAIDENGWLHTGDLGKMDIYGNLTLQGRIKDIIIRGGENISPVEIEEALMELGWFDAVKVLSAPHYSLGESVMACVVPKPGSSVTEASIRESLAGRLSTFKIPEFVFFYQRFPLNENGKLDQRRLKVDELELAYNRRLIEQVKKGAPALTISVANADLYIDPTKEYVRKVVEKIGGNDVLISRVTDSTEKIMRLRMALSPDEEDIIMLRLSFAGWSLVLEYIEDGKSNVLVRKKAESECLKEFTGLTDRASVLETEDGGYIFRLEFDLDENFNWNQLLFTESEYRDWKENRG